MISENGRIISQFDSFLDFANLFLMQVSLRGELINIRPKEKDFFGWDFQNRKYFNLLDHFLSPNHLTMDLLFQYLEDKNFSMENFSWKGYDNKISKPIPTFFQLIESSETNKNILIFAKPQEESSNGHLPINEKRYIYQAEYLPGLIHNINGPLGTIMGRIELLQLKHPELSDLDEIIRVNYRIQSLIDNVSYKISQETLKSKTKINLNRFLREELSFRNSDLFFKHKVEKVKELEQNIPEFSLNYFDLSGIFSECYRFMRQFVNEKNEYVFLIKSEYNNYQGSFSVDFKGEFNSQGNRGGMLPGQIQGNANDMYREVLLSLDCEFLAECMENSKGILVLNCTPQHMKFQYDFPLPEE
jgi:hypothetical protein